MRQSTHMRERVYVYVLLCVYKNGHLHLCVHNVCLYIHVTVCRQELYRCALGIRECLCICAYMFVYMCTWCVDMLSTRVPVCA